ncbi:MAG: hypothetical protein ACJAWO_002335, partial [Halieaceae bacterium]
MDFTLVFLGIEAVSVIFLVFGIILLLMFLYYVPVGLWFQAYVTNVKISIIQLFFMRIRK